MLVNSRDLSSGETALHIVTERRDPVWLRFLLAKGANPNLADGNGTTRCSLPRSSAFRKGRDPCRTGRLGRRAQHHR